MLREFAGVTAVLLLAGGALVHFQPTDFVPQAQPLQIEPEPPIAAPVAKVERTFLKPLPMPMIAGADKHLPADAVAMTALPARMLSVSADMTGEESHVAARLASRVPAQVAPYFDVFVYVSKARDGAWAQRLFLFKKNQDGALTFDEKITVSTGRERSEQYFTSTPTGLFQLDPNRFMRMAYSNKWNGAPMPHAMFFNVDYRNQKSGIALHAAHGARGLAELGTRASGGCVRLPPEKAESLFNRFKTERGLVPVFAFDEARGSTSNEGRILQDASGKPYVVNGVRVLVLIENYAGSVDLASAY
jgi:hypothetical protein